MPLPDSGIHMGLGASAMSRKFVVFGALTSALALSACGGGGGGSSTTLAPGTRVSTGVYTAAFPEASDPELLALAETAIQEFIALNESPTTATNIPTTGTFLYQNVDGAYIRVLSGPNAGSYVADTAIVINYDAAGAPTVDGAFSDLGGGGLDLILATTTLTGDSFSTSIAGTNQIGTTAGSGPNGVQGTLLGDGATDLLGIIDGNINGDPIDGTFTGTR